MTTMFFGERPEVMRLDQLKYPFFMDLRKKQRGYHWIPEEIEVGREAKDFRGMFQVEQNALTYNLQRQIVLDSKQGRGPVEVLGPLASLPEIELWIRTWSAFEDLHSESYQYIIEGIYPDASVIYDEINHVPEIQACVRDIGKHYDALAAKPTKENLWMCINAINALEGVRFYVSFACAWAFAETKRMEGNAKIIKLICRDENLHLAGTQQMLKLLPKDDPEFVEIAEAKKADVVQLFEEVVEQEKDWAKFLFRDGSMIGLNGELLCNYVEHIAHKRMLTLGLPSPFKGGSNPLPWTQKWIQGQDVQVAPQEVQISSYVIGGINQDVTKDTFKDFKL